MLRPPDAPGVRLSIVGDRTAGSRCDEGYLRVRRYELAARREGAATSEPFRYDVLERWNMDAVAIVPHFLRDGVRHVLLRSSVRPPVALRPDPIIDTPTALSVDARAGELWEIPAGLVEADERSAEGLVAGAIRETAEEIGLTVEPAAMRPLGGPIFPSAGIVGELIYFFACAGDRATRREPGGDGSPLERDAKILEVPLARALSWCAEGLLPDAKTELGLLRLERRFPDDARSP
ncbi:MAG: hypothetical protein NVS3B10_04540 [Polyangiales bacterium]